MDPLIPVCFIPLPAYQVDARPDYAAIGPQLDRYVKARFCGRSLVLRGLSLGDYPNQSRVDLVAIFLGQGTDLDEPGAPNRIALYGIACESTDALPSQFGPDSNAASPFAQYLEDFHERARSERSSARRMDMVLVYDLDQLAAVPGAPQGFAFKQPGRKSEALLGIVNLLRADELVGYPIPNDGTMTTYVRRRRPDLGQDGGPREGGIPVYELALPQYTVAAKPDYLTVGSQIDQKIQEIFAGRRVLMRCLTVADHPGKSLDELVQVILELGHDRYDSTRLGVHYTRDRQEALYAGFYGGMETARVVGLFYTGPPADRNGPPIRIDLLLFYDPDKMEHAQAQPAWGWREELQTRMPDAQIGDYHNDHAGEYWFADPTDKPGALLGVLKILR